MDDDLPVADEQLDRGLPTLWRPRDHRTCRRELSNAEVLDTAVEND